MPDAPSLYWLESAGALVYGQLATLRGRSGIGADPTQVGVSTDGGLTWETYAPR